MVLVHLAGVRSRIGPPVLDEDDLKAEGSLAVCRSDVIVLVTVKK